MSTGGIVSMGGMSRLGMDDIMGDMMSNMNMKSSSSKMMSSSSSSFSSSSSSSSKMLSSNMGGISLPPMRGMEMPDIKFEEMSSLPPSSVPRASPDYTITSPPMSPPPEMKHKVQKAADYAPQTTESADTTVLLKFKDGSDYKLALNMQQFSPEDITIKLNGNDLTIEASTSEEQFHQKHQIPGNIDLDGMSSSFSSDGVLVIKAPNK